MGLIPDFYLVQIAFAPLPPPYSTALSSMEVETSIGEASVFRLSFDLSRNAFGDFDALAVDIFRPNTPIRISVALGAPIPQTLINGYIREASLSGSNEPGGSRLEVVGMDALGTLMGVIEQPFIWPNLPDSEVARIIFGKYAILPSFVIPTPPTRTMLDTTTTQRVSDARYLIQLAQRNAYELFIQPDPLIGLDNGFFRPPLPVQPPQGVLSIDFGTETNLNSFQVSNDMLRPTSVVSLSSDPRTRAPIPAAAPVATELPMGLEPSLLRILPPPIERPAETDAANPAEVQFQAMARVNETSRAVNASGEVDGTKFKRPLRVGMPVLVRGVGRQMSGLYYVTHVTHRISQDEYTQSFRAWRNAVGLTGVEVFVDPLAAVS
jgi:hypothetical protein